MATGNMFLDAMDEETVVPARTSVPAPVATGVNPFMDALDFEEESELTLRPKSEVKPGFLDRTKGTIQDTATSIVDTVMGQGPDWNAADPMAVEQQPAGRKALHVLGGDLIPAVSNVLVDAGFTAARQFIPDSWEDAIVDHSKEAWDVVSSKPGVKEGLEMAKQGMEAYGEWAKENPMLARDLESVINIAAVAVPLARGPGAGKAGAAIERRGQQISRNNRKAQVTKLMEPIGKKGDGTLTLNQWGTKEYVPSKWETEMNREVMRVPGFKPNRSFTENTEAVRERAKYYKDELETHIKKKKNPTIDKVQLQVGLANRVNAIDTDTLLVGDAAKMGRKIFKKAKKLIDKSDGTAQGILDARRELDQWLISQKGNVYDSSMESAVGVAARQIRGAMNDAVGKAVGSSRVKTLLDRQHKLLSAGDLLEAKALKEADTYIGRIIGKLEHRVGTKLPTTPLALGATIGAGAAVAGGVVPAAATVGTLLAGYKGVKWLSSGEGAQWLGRLVKAAETNPAIMPEVQALVQLSQGLTPEEQNAKQAK